VTNSIAGLTTHLYGAATIAALTGEIDTSNARQLQRDILTASAGARNFVVDLSEVSYIDSAGLAVLHGLASIFASERRSLRIVCPSKSPAARLMRMVVLDRIIPMAERVDDVLADFGEPLAQ
jgi:anti-anti-sigma factor